MKLSLEKITALPAPYPVAMARHVFADQDLRQMRAAWPPASHFESNGGGYVKQSLAPSHSAYAEILQRPIWSDFADAIRDASFYDTVRQWFAMQLTPIAEIKSTWFEFTSMSTGGTLPPHTDAASKVVTMIVWMMAPDEWSREWGGGLDVYNESQGMQCYEYEYNSAILVARRPNSWHGISPLRCPPDVRRRTITVCFQP